jgi:N-formylglutamate amidohydrolase
MPSRATGYHLKKNPNQDTGRRKDFCLSNLNGMSCQKSYITGFKEGLELQDYKVSINDPYFGGYVTQFMDDNFRGNVIQCEINRDIYMDENEKKMLEKKVIENDKKNLEKKLIVEDELNEILTKIIVDVFIAFNTPFVQNQMVEADGEERDNIDAQFAFSF